MLFVVIFYASYAFGMILIICELGQRLTDAFEQVANKIKNIKWYLFSPEIQRLLPILIMVSQKPIVVQCFGNISGIRKTFKKVCPSIDLSKFKRS